MTKKILCFLFYSLFVLKLSYSWAQDPLFNKYPVFNSKVESFIDHFIMHLFSEEITQISTQFSNQSDSSKGFLQGSFNSLIFAPEKPNSDFLGTFLFYIDSMEGGSLEYGLNFKLEAQIQPLDSLLAVISDKLSFCLSDQSEKKYLDSFCKTHQDYQWDPAESTVTNLSHILYLWKAHFIEQLQQLQDPDLQGFQQELASWVRQNIVITQDEQSVTLDVDFSNLKRDFSGKASAFLRKTKLVDLSLESLQIQFFEDTLFIDLHIKKLHVAKRINLYVELLAQLQSFIEDSERAVKLGQALREDLKNRNFNELKLLKQLNIKEGVSLGATLGSAVLNANKNNDIVSSQTEEDLGLE